MLSTSPTLGQRLLPHVGPLAQPVVRRSLLVLGGSILMVLCAQIRIPLPFSPVPITMQTFGVLLVGALLGPRLGALAMLAYIAEALAGLPVLAGGLSAWSPSSIVGLPAIVGPTAGYLLSFPLAAAVVGALAARGWDRSVARALPAMLVGDLVILLCGFAWLLVISAMFKGMPNILSMLQLAVLPFLPGDAFKIVLAACALPGGWALLQRRSI